MEGSSDDSFTVSSEKDTVSSADEVVTVSTTDSEDVVTDIPSAPPESQNELEQKKEIARILDSGRRPFDVTLRGGPPWGFALNGGTGSNIPLYISKIVEGGKASLSALVEGDYLMCVNEKPCSAVGEALDIVDTADNSLTVTVLRGLRGDLPPAGPLVSQSQSFLTRAYDLKKKERSVLNQFNDDSVVYSQSRSSQKQNSVGMRPNKKRGDSFNVSRHTESGLARKENRHHPKVQPGSLDPSSWPQPIDSRCSLPTESRAYHDRNTSANVSQSTSSNSSLVSQMNRRRSEGHGLSSYRASQQQQQQQQQHQEAPVQKQSNLLSMKSSPNLVQTDGASDRSRDGHLVEQKSVTGTKSTPSIPGDLNKPQSGWSAGNVTSRSGNALGSSLDIGSVYANRNSGVLSYTANMYTPEMESSKQKNLRRSMPFSNLHRYMPDYENVNNIGSAPLRSEKISEIDDIDEVTGRDSLPNSPSPKALSPNPHAHGEGLPTRDPSSLKYIKVNQNHEKYPSWPVTKPNGASEQSQPINSRAVSMTDHTNTSKEFPHKQVLAYTPGLNPLAEKNSPTSERKGEDGRLRNTSDPGFNSGFVYDRFGRVQRKNYDNIEQKFDDFYNNSKPGYPPPNMDPDGHNIGDKNYNAPSPPERENKAINENELSNRLDKVQGKPMDSNKTTRQQTSSEYQRTCGSDLVSKSEHKSRPTQLNLHPSHSSTRTDSGTSPLEKMQSPRQAWNMDQTDSLMSSGRDQKSMHRNHMQSYNLVSPGFQNEVAYSGGGGAIHSGRAKSYKEQPSFMRSPSSTDPHSHIDRSRPASYTSHSAASSGSNDSSKAFIVKQTPYYNTSTQTEMMPYAVKLSSPLANQPGNKVRNAEIQVGNFGTQTSPQSPHDLKGKLFEEKSIQARMSRDFQGSELDSSLDKISMDSKRPASGGDFFRYPPSSSLASQPSQFLSREGIQAKYSTDETPSDSSISMALTGIPHFSENTAPILRKLSEEFYGGRLNQMQDKRSMSSTSSQEMSPRHDASSLTSALHQPGMREAESYSSVVIHPDVSSTLFGRDDYAGSVSSMGDSRNDASFSDTSSNYKALDFGAPRARNSLDPALGTQKGRFLMQQQDPIRSGSTPSYKHSREHSAPVSSSAYTNMLPRSSHLSSSADYLATDSAISSGSDVSSLASQSRSSSSAQTSMSPIGDKSVASDVSSSIQTRPLSSSDHFSNKRLSSDSVFESADDRETEESQGYQFSRKPSLRKAYGIYDETERLISQGKSLNKTLEQTNTGGDPNSMYAVASRGTKYSESLGLGQIKEEGDPSLNEDDTKMPSTTSKSLLEGRVMGRREEKQQKHQYAWQNKSWWKSRPEFEFPRGSNLKRTTSEQIAMPKGPVGLTPSSYDAEMPSLSTHLPLQASESTGLLHMPRSQSESSSFKSPNDAELKKVQQQAVLSFYQRKASGSGGGGQGRPSLSSTSSKDSPSPDSSMYESIGNQSRSTAESVSDIISKANENLAKSAQRVDSIRRSNSASSRHSSDYMEMARHDRMRKETEWSKLRTSGSIRYSPEHSSGIRSNRSSYASENHYEDIGMFASSTPTEEKRDMGDNESLEPDASMDTGVMTSPTYLNVPVKRRPPPPLPPRSPSPDSPPPALPPRNYKENIHSYNNASNNNNNNGSANNYNKSNIVPLSQHPNSGSRGQQLPSTPHNVLDAGQRARTLPMAKTQPFLPEEEPSVDNSKRDFKSLMSQWENSSPREERYAAELRRQAQLRLTTQKLPVPNHSQNLHQQQQPQQQQQQQQQQQHPLHPNAMPMSVKHSKPAISLATTYKREPTLPQEATSPLAASSIVPSSSSAIMPPSSSHFASTHHQSSVSSSSSALSAPQPSSLSSTSLSMPNYPSSSVSVVSSAPQPSAFYKQHPVGGSGHSPYHEGTNHIGSHATVVTANLGHHAFPTSSSSSSSFVAALPPQIPHRAGLLEESRNRSNSDASLVPSQSSRGPGSSRTASHVQPYRDRSSSDNDILDDRKGVASSSLVHFNASRSSPAPSTASSSSSSTNNNAPSSTTPISPKDKSPAATKWRPKRGPVQPPPPTQSNSSEETEVSEGEFPPPPPPEALQILEQSDEGFADESYIGHKSKTSRPIGTYKRSKSAAALQTDNNNYKIAGESDNSTFPEKKLGQQSWNSESVLQPHPANSQGAASSSILPGNRIGSIPEQPSANNVDTPPARPPARVSHAARQYPPAPPIPPHESPTSSLPANSPSSTSTSSSPSTHNISSHPSPSRSSTTTSTGADPVFTARPFVIEQPGWVAHRDSPRRQPPPVPNSPPFDPDAPQFSDPSSQAPPALSATSHDHQKRQQAWSSPISDAMAPATNRDGIPSQYSQHSPHRQPTTDRSPAVENSWGSPHSTVASSPSSSSQANNSNNNSFQSHLPNNNDDALPMTPPPRDYNRRDSAPARQAAFDPRSIPISSDVFASLAHRRQSESSVTTPRSENDNSDLSTHSSSSHTRQPSQEELECDLKAKQLAQELENKEQKLSEVLRLDNSRKRMHYMDGLFSDSFSGVDGVNSTDNKSTQNLDIDESDNRNISDLTTSNPSTVKNNLANDNGRRQNLPKEYWMSAPKALVEMQIRQNQEMVKDLTRDIKDSSSLMKQKEELLESLSKKLDVLEEDKISVQKEIEQNDTMGVQIFDLIKSKCAGHSVMDKVNAFNDDQEKIVRLMLNLSGQLARAENAVQALDPDADSKAKKLASDKLRHQRSKYEEAKSIKEDMDKRKEQVTSLVHEHLEDNESKLFALFLLKKPQLTIELQELEDKIKLGREQMDELKKSIPENKNAS